MSERSLKVTDATFRSEVLEADKPVLVDFWAEWCGPCQALAPVIDELAIEQGDQLKVVKVNVDDSPGLSASGGRISTSLFSSTRCKVLSE